jgi:hypothetical protein
VRERRGSAPRPLAVAPSFPSTRRGLAPPEQTIQRDVEFGGQLLESRGRGRWIGAYHKQATSRQPVESVPHQVSEPSFDLVSGHRAPDGLTHHETHKGWLFPRSGEMHHQGGAPSALAAPDRSLELLPASHAGLTGQHRIRLTPAGVMRRRAVVARDGQADSLSRPLRRRAARMARPARVRMRSRKPWVFARRRLFGWKVRLLTGGLQA